MVGRIVGGALCGIGYVLAAPGAALVWLGERVAGQDSPLFPPEPGRDDWVRPQDASARRAPHTEP